MRILTLQRVCTSYRVPLFKKLSNIVGVDFTLLIGADIPDSKVKNATALAGVNFHKFETSFIKLGRYTFPWHIGLLKYLRIHRPEVIICEGESHFLGYLVAIFYKLVFDRNVALIHWCFIGLPGEEHRIRSLNFRIKRFLYNFFDAFLLYSSYSKKRLVEMGQPAIKGFVATNVGNVELLLKISSDLDISESNARSKLGLPDNFTVLYVGTLDRNKKPDLLLALASRPEFNTVNFVLLGKGDMYDELLSSSNLLPARNVFVKGHVGDDLPIFYKAASCLLVPGRGGIVISEAMSFGVPVIVYQADGTEYDLVNAESGILLKCGEENDFANAIALLLSDGAKHRCMKEKSQKLITCKYNTNNMIEKVLLAANFASKSGREKV